MDQALEDIIHKVHALMKAKSLSLSVAESCTGGLISHYLTILPNASAFFEAGVVTYSAGTKKMILGISPATISNYGVVSEQTVRAMAEKMRTLTGTDISLSTTGNLGPDVLEGKEKGLIYIAVSRGAETFTRQLKLKGSRIENKEEAAFIALQFLADCIER